MTYARKELAAACQARNAERLNAAQYRAALRKLVSPLVREHWRSFKDAMQRSPLIGNGEKQIDVRIQPSAFRDELGVPAMIGLMVGDVTPQEMIDAIVDPEHFAMELSGANTKTGYSFGWPRSYTLGKFKECFDALVSEGAVHAGPEPAAPLLPEPPQERIEEAARNLTIKGIDSSVTWIDKDGHIHQEGVDLTAVAKEAVAKAAVSSGGPKLESALTVVGIVRGMVPEKDPEEIIHELERMMEESGVDEQARMQMGLGLRAAVKLSGTPSPPEQVPAEISQIVNEMKRRLSVDDGMAGVPTTKEVALPDTVNPQFGEAINALCRSAGLPPLHEIIKVARHAKQVESDLRDMLTNVRGEMRVKTSELEKANREADELRGQLVSARQVVLPSVVEAASDGTEPEGKMEMRKANELFDVSTHKKLFGFDVPTFAWEGVHPRVPKVDPSYLFEPSYLVRLLRAILNNDKPWLQGHTGCGKSTLVQQIAARLGWPVIRVNFDGHISRGELVGRDVLKVVDAKSASEFVDGVLPQAVAGCNILLLDEIDFVQPDVSYVLQRVLEDFGMLLPEDGGRVVAPHAFFRIVATANTNGQGDEYGLYQGARAQSMAFLDRFRPFVKIEYLKEEREAELMKRKVPGLKAEMYGKFAKYAVEHREAFVGGQIMQPLSPRGLESMARNYQQFLMLMGSSQKAMEMTLEGELLDRANSNDRAKISGIADRVFG